MLVAAAAEAAFGAQVPPALEAPGVGAGVGGAQRACAEGATSHNNCRRLPRSPTPALSMFGFVHKLTKN